MMSDDLLHSHVELVLCDGEGVELERGFSPFDSRAHAQAVANERGESVYLSRSDEDELGEEFEPEEDEEAEIIAEAKEIQNNGGKSWFLIEAPRFGDHDYGYGTEDEANEYALLVDKMNDSDCATYERISPDDIDGARLIVKLNGGDHGGMKLAEVIKIMIDTLGD